MPNQDTKWEPTTKPWIVCAANKHQLSGRIVCGARHWDSVMRGQVQDMDGVWDKSWGDAEQGFIDQWGRFYTREEAMEIARQNDQVINYDDMLSVTALHSEDLY